MDKRQALALAILAVGDVIERHSDPEGIEEWQWARVELQDMLRAAKGLAPRKEPAMEPTFESDRARRAYQILSVAPYPPTVRELARAAGYEAHSQLHAQLCEWREAGLVTWETGKIRTLRVV